MSSHKQLRKNIQVLTSGKVITFLTDEELHDAITDPLLDAPGYVVCSVAGYIVTHITDGAISKAYAFPIEYSPSMRLSSEGMLRRGYVALKWVTSAHEATVMTYSEAQQLQSHTKGSYIRRVPTLDSRDISQSH